MRRLQRPRKRQLTEIVKVACGLVHAANGVRSVHVVAGRRPTYGEMLRYRKAARDEQVDLTVDREGGITIRQGPLCEEM